MKPYGLRMVCARTEPTKLSRAREKLAANRLLALDVDDACPCGCDDGWERGTPPDFDDGDGDLPIGYREPTFATIGDCA